MQRYTGPPFYFCASRNPFYTEKQCNGETELVPPKKARVYNKPKHQMTRRELIRWANNFRYR